MLNLFWVQIVDSCRFSVLHGVSLHSFIVKAGQVVQFRREDFCVVWSFGILLLSRCLVILLFRSVSYVVSSDIISVLHIPGIGVKLRNHISGNVSTRLISIVSRIKTNGTSKKTNCVK